MLSVLPAIRRETAFALKGGTAINLFYRDLPRLSVDLDLTWLPIADRRSSLRDIDDALDRIAATIAARHPRIDVRRIAGGGAADTRVMIRDGRAQVK
ncbi:MAG: nucleotidyl transferase AbiEii/AbiGii toxin family protein, partial [Gammaproteobacteria bacterium]|nr:nucleotidyl transferase AbiEii/AbiGii toxin family protein [Gammaproteobacteria bacterium]